MIGKNGIAPQNLELSDAHSSNPWRRVLNVSSKPGQGKTTAGLCPADWWDRAIGGVAGRGSRG